MLPTLLQSALETVRFVPLETEKGPFFPKNVSPESQK